MHGCTPAFSISRIYVFTEFEMILVRLFENFHHFSVAIPSYLDCYKNVLNMALNIIDLFAINIRNVLCNCKNK